MGPFLGVTHVTRQSRYLDRAKTRIEKAELASQEQSFASRTSCTQSTVEAMLQAMLLVLQQHRLLRQYSTSAGDRGVKKN